MLKHHYCTALIYPGRKKKAYISYEMAYRVKSKCTVEAAAPEQLLAEFYPDREVMGSIHGNRPLNFLKEQFVIIKILKLIFLLNVPATALFIFYSIAKVLQIQLQQLILQ